MPRGEAIRDPIHGYVPISALERRGLDSVEVQRLRRISQLGLTELVYPGARHSRFEHAVGALAVVTRLFEELRGRLGLDAWLPAVGRAGTEAEFAHLVAVARWTALLHDLGHAPFSHVTESLLAPGEQHEDRTLRLVEEGAVGAVLADGGAQLRDDVRTCLDLSRTPGDPALRLVREAIAGPLGADRMDYLLRDSRATGVSYGLFDLDRVLHTIVPVADLERGGVRLGIDRGGVSAAEGMLWARASMFGQVYQHRTRRILDRHLLDFLGAVLPGGRYPTETEDYLQWDDPRIWEALRVADSDPSAPGHRDARRILRRGHHRALDRQIDGADPTAVLRELERWSSIAIEIDPAFDPRSDLVELRSDPSRSGDIPVVDGGGDRFGGGRVRPLREHSDLSERLQPRCFGRLYVALSMRGRGGEIIERAESGSEPRS
ncbi:MAG: HD domain-containing protein [Planctomycetota bacterium]|jgi:HD superfamily phosphohydrolase